MVIRKNLIDVTLMAVTLLMSNALFAEMITKYGTVKSGNLAEYRLVGFTSTKTDGCISKADGSAGFTAMHNYCKEEVAPNARACFSSEALRPPLVTTGSGWFLSSPGSTVVMDNLGNFVAIDGGGTGAVTLSEPTPSDALSSLDCNSYTDCTANVRGLFAYASTGDVSPFRCDIERAIACCAPVSVSLAPLK